MQDIIMDRNQYITPVSIIRNLVKNSVYAIKIYTNKLCCTSNIKFFFLPQNVSWLRAFTTHAGILQSRSAAYTC